MDPDEMAELEMAAGFDQAFDDPYCDLCETVGHRARACPRRDDDVADVYDEALREAGL